MRNRLAALVTALTTTFAAIAFTAAVAGCSGCSSPGAAHQDAAVLASSSSECSGGGGDSQPSPKGLIQTQCVRDFEGPDNLPVGSVTVSIEFTCGVSLDAVTLTVTVWHSGGGGVSIGDKPEASKTCDSIEAGACTVTVPCTEGVYLGAFSLTATVNGQLVTDADQTTKTSYSAGDCTI